MPSSLFKKRSPNARRKFYYTFKITEQEYLNLKSYLKTQNIPYKRRIKLNFKISNSFLIALGLIVALIVSAIIFVKVMR